MLIEKLKIYGIRPLEKDELGPFNLSDSYGSFKSVFDDINMTDQKEAQIKTNLDDKTGLKEYSFLNNWFVFKKD